MPWPPWADRRHPKILTPSIPATPATGGDLLDLLKQRFGYDEFRPGQRAIISNALDGRHGLVVMPTGGGKSLCYQLPALALGGLTLVVSPLIALMKDQVDSLRANGISAEFLNSSLDNSTAAAIERSAQAGAVNLLYVAPERVVMPGFRRFLRTLDLKLIAIDEAHCISEWGHDFRPDYRALSELRAEFPQVPVMALTATATQRVRQDIVDQLGLDPCGEFISGFDRPNLSYRLLPRKNSWDALLNLLEARSGQSVIIYCLSRRETEDLAGRLTASGHPAAAYHAGLDADIRRLSQERFIDGEVPIVVATIAFGMGIDKPDIRLVVHYTLPKSIEGYYQETGRAGRDGMPSECVLFFSDGEERKHDYFVNRIEDNDLRHAARQQLLKMVDYARLSTCRRKFLLEYFGDEVSRDSCGNCDNCSSERRSVDVTVVAQKMLSAVIRTGERFGFAHVANVLLGSNVARVRELGHNQLSVFGIVDDYDRTGLRQIANGLVETGLMARSDGQYPTLSVTDAGRAWLHSRQSLTLNLRVDDEPPQRNTASAGAAAATHFPASPAAAGLFARLRTLRRRLADQQGVPAFVVFNDATLRNLAAAQPTRPEDMLRVSGVGPAKLDKYGAQFLAEIRQHLGGDAARSGRQPSAIESRLNRSSDTNPGGPLADTYLSTFRMLGQGLTIADIAEQRGLTEQTVVAHVERIVAAGHSVDLTLLMPPTERVDRILDALSGFDGDRLAPVRESLGDDFSYEEIRLVRILRGQT